MSDELEIEVCREDKPDDEEYLKVKKDDRVKQLIKVAKEKLYPDEIVSLSDLYAYRVDEGKSTLLLNKQKMSELADINLVKICHKPCGEPEAKKTDTTIWIAKETNPKAMKPINISDEKTVYELLQIVKDELFKDLSLDDIHAVELSSKKLIPRDKTIKEISGQQLLFRHDRPRADIDIEKLSFNQEEEIKKVKDAKIAIIAAREKTSGKTLEEQKDIIKNLQENFGIKDEMPQNLSSGDIKQRFKELEDAVSKEESSLNVDSIDFTKFSVKDRCQELMDHISGNGILYEIEKPIILQSTNEKIYKHSEEEIERVENNKVTKASKHDGWNIGADAAVPLGSFFNLSTSFGHGRNKSSISGHGMKNENAKKSMKARVSNQHYQQVIKFNIAKTKISKELEQDAKAVGEASENGKEEEEEKASEKTPEEQEEEEKRLIEFLKKYPDKVYTGPFGAGGWYEFITTVESSKVEDLAKLQKVATDENRRKTEIAANIKVAGLGGGGLELGSQKTGRTDEMDGTSSENTVMNYSISTTFNCEGPSNITTPTSLSAKLTSPNNWTVFPSCDEKNPRFTPIYTIIEDFAREKDDDVILYRAASKLEKLLKNGPQYVIRDAVIPHKALSSDRPKNVILFGKTGQGKSLLGNVVLGNYKAFKVGEGTESCTKENSARENRERRIRIHDTNGLCDTADYKIGMHWLAGNTKAIRAILKTWESIGVEGLDCVVFVQKRAKISSEDAALAKFAKEKLFGGDISERVILILTDSTNKQIMDKSERLKFLENESKTESGNFSELYKLVNSDPDRVFFVNNKNPDAEVEVEALKAKHDNVSMAELVLEAIHSIDLPAHHTPIGELEKRRIELEERRIAPKKEISSVRFKDNKTKSNLKNKSESEWEKTKRQFEEELVKIEVEKKEKAEKTSRWCIIL